MRTLVREREKPYLNLQDFENPEGLKKSRAEAPLSHTNC